MKNSIYKTTQQLLLLISVSVLSIHSSTTYAQDSICLNANEFEHIDFPMEYYEGGYIKTTEKRDGKVTYQVYVEESGHFNLSALVRPHGKYSNSFYLDINDRKSYIWQFGYSNGLNNVFSWHSHPDAYYLREGVNTLVFRGRERNTDFKGACFSRILADEINIYDDQASYDETLVSDFDARDFFPQSEVDPDEWKNSGSWGPSAAIYPHVLPPHDVNTVQWQRDRIVEVAKKYIGTPYAHAHIPYYGLDCSNFTSWVFNYGLGIKFTSHVKKQAESFSAGRTLDADEKLIPGDLLFTWNKDHTAITHVMIYLGFNNDGIEQLIDSTKGSVEIRNFSGWYKTRFSHAKRLFE